MSTITIQKDELIPSSDAAGFYLVYLFMSQRLYHESFAYLTALSGVRLYGLNEWRIFQAITDLPDYSLEAAALRLQVASEVIQNSTLHIRERYHQERAPFDQEEAFWVRILDDYTRILQHTGSGSQRLKEEMFLSSEEEKHLIVMLEKKTPFEVWNNHPTVRKQWTAFFGEKAPAVEEEPNSNRLLDRIVFSNDYKNTPIPNDLVRLFSGPRSAEIKLALPTFFLSFYEAARTAPPEKSVIDLDLHMLQYLKDEESQGLLEILRRVRANPARFPAYSGQNNIPFCKEIQTIAKECTYPIPKIAQSNRVPQIRENALKERARPHRLQVYAKYSVRPLSAIMEANFERQVLSSVADEPFALQGMTVGDDPLAAKLLTDLEKAHQTNLKRSFTTYSVKADPNALRTNLENHLNDCTTQSTLLKSQIERVANSPLEDEDNNNTFTIQEIQRLSDQLCGRSSRITIQDLLPHFMIHHGDGVKKLNGSLDDEQVQAIFDLMKQYLLLQCEIDQAREALKFANQGQLVEAAEVLDKERLYDPEAFPELLAYEYATGKFLRPRQAEILQWIFRSRNPKEIKELLLEFEAGGGKTQVVAAILAFRYMMEGYLPIFFSLPELQDISKEDLRQPLMRAFQMKLSPLEIGLHDQLSCRELETILSD